MAWHGNGGFERMRMEVVGEGGHRWWGKDAVSRNGTAT